MCTASSGPRRGTKTAVAEVGDESARSLCAGTEAPVESEVSVEVAPAYDCGDADPIADSPRDSVPAIQVVVDETPPDGHDADEQMAVVSQPTVASRTVEAAVPARSWGQALPGLTAVMRGLLIAWFSISAVIAIGQVIRILRFRRRLSGAPCRPRLLDRRSGSNRPVAGRFRPGLADG